MYRPIVTWIPKSRRNPVLALLQVERADSYHRIRVQQTAGSGGQEDDSHHTTCNGRPSESGLANRRMFH